MKRTLLPAALLLAYGIAFGWTALGGGVLIFDDHPGQLYRLHHAVALGWAPWRLNPGWWAGYAELQYYPPGASWLGAAIHEASLGALHVEQAYQTVLWIAWLLPGLTTFALLARVLGSGWLALPGAFVALTLSAGSRSGVEEGLRWGLVAARLGWDLLPLVGLSLVSWVEGGRRAPLRAAPLLAAVILLHPAHAPAALALIGLGTWLGRGEWKRRAAQACLVAALGLGLSAIWLFPLLAHLDMTLPLAWGDAGPGLLARLVAAQPWVLLLLGLYGIGATRMSAHTPAGRWLLALFPTILALVLFDAYVAEAAGILWIPADRLVDSLLLALVLGAAVGVRVPLTVRAGLWVVAPLLFVLWLGPGKGEPLVTVWPARGEWPKYDAVVRATHIDALWRALGDGPPGRVLFLRSTVALDPGPEWWRPHSHITALTPLATGRGIVNGTFTHPSPIAGLFYTGSADPRPITMLVERRDGVTLFGRPLESLSAAEFSGWAERLGISAVVATDADRGRLTFLDSNRDFLPPRTLGPFALYVSRVARALPEPVGPQAWRFTPSAGASGWTATGFAYSPLWRAESSGQPLSVRRDFAGMLEVQVPRNRGEITLHHRPGAAEKAGGLLATISALFLAVAWAAIFLVDRGRPLHDRA